MLKWDELHEKSRLQEQRRSGCLESRAPPGVQTRIPQRLGNDGAPLQ